MSKAFQYVLSYTEIQLHSSLVCKKKQQQHQNPKLWTWSWALWCEQFYHDGLCTQQATDPFKR